MQFLLDTHVFIWALAEPQLLSPKTRQVLEDGSNQAYVSVASLWEMVIKSAKGKLKMPKNIATILEKRGFSQLEVMTKHVLKLKDLPLIHKDPFDRLLIAQAQSENFTLITADEQIQKYPVTLLPA